MRELLDKEGVTVRFPAIDASLPIRQLGSPSCKVACPAGVNIKAYLNAIARRDFTKALQIVKEQNPLPGICGRVCTHPCESECRRGDFDDPIAICALKRFIADYGLTHKEAFTGLMKRTRGQTIAIIGSGPAGLVAAHDLVRMGYGVTIFEALSQPGGMLTWAIPSFRLPRNIIQSEIDDIVSLGVVLKTSTAVTNIEQLFTQGFNAVCVAIGAHKGLGLQIPGEHEFAGVVDCIHFLRSCTMGTVDKPGDRVVVIGGGNSAVDAARSAIRLGSKQVSIVYRRSSQEMPANKDDILEALNEGVMIEYLTQPVRICGRNGRVRALECIRTQLGEPDASGRRRPVPVPGSEFTIETDFIVSAISQKPDISCFKDCGLAFSRDDTLLVDEKTLATSKPGIFAGGDVVTGPNTIIHAIAAGHRAAHSIDRYLRGLTSDHVVTTCTQYELASEETVPERAPRSQIPKTPVHTRKNSFLEVELTVSEEDAVREAQRCLRCGTCVECVRCLKECRKRMVGLITHDSKELLVTHAILKSLYAHGTLQGVLSVGDEACTDVRFEPVIARVEDALCRGCGSCKDVCNYAAIAMREEHDGMRQACVDISLCRGCGICAAVCPTGAMSLPFFSTDTITEKLVDCMAEKPIQEQEKE